MHVKYRDVRHHPLHRADRILHLAGGLQCSSIVPEKWRLLYSLNPMVGVIDGFRWSILEEPPPCTCPDCISLATTSFFLWLGVTYFQTERSFADVI